MLDVLVSSDSKRVPEESICVSMNEDTILFMTSLKSVESFILK